jgi:hypothetical protein
MLEVTKNIEHKNVFDHLMSRQVFNGKKRQKNLWLQFSAPNVCSLYYKNLFLEDVIYEKGNERERGVNFETPICV